MPTQSQRLETAISTLETLVANTTGTGDMVLKTSPVLVTPTLGVASATSLTVAVAVDGRRGIFAQSSFTAFSSANAQTILIDYQGGEIQCKLLSINGNYIGFGGSFATSGGFGVTLTVTGTTNVTLPTSGTLATNAAATTSTAGLVELSDAAEALAGVNTSVVMTPALSALQDASPIVKDGFSGAGWTQYASPTGGFSTGNTDFGVDISFGTATGGTGRYNGPGNTAALYVGKGRGVINWSKPGAVSFLLLFYTAELDAVSTFRFGWGKSSSGLTWGDPAVKYIGIARTGTGVLRIQTHNGTTLTNTNTTFTPTLNQAAFVHLSWDGAGNVAITVNGTSYGTATGAPTGDGSSTENRLIAEGQNTSTATLQGNVQVSDLALTRHMF